MSVLSHFSCVWVFATPWTVAHQAPLSMGFSRQKYWRGLPWPPPEDLPDPGIEPEFPCLLHYRWILYHWATREAHTSIKNKTIILKRSPTTDHHNKFNNKVNKVWNIVRITKMWHRDRMWANTAGKQQQWASQCRAATDFQSIKSTQ